MHVGCQILVGDDFPAQHGERIALFYCQGGAQIGFVLGS
jgi:hypothetical protein